MKEDQILNVGRVIITLLGTLSFIAPELIPQLNEVFTQTVGATFVIIESVGFVIDQLKKNQESTVNALVASSGIVGLKSCGLTKPKGSIARRLLLAA